MVGEGTYQAAKVGTTDAFDAARNPHEGTHHSHFRLTGEDRSPSPNGRLPALSTTFSESFQISHSQHDRPRTMNRGREILFHCPTAAFMVDSPSGRLHFARRPPVLFWLLAIS
jgi:hypothetical protein